MIATSPKLYVPSQEIERPDVLELLRDLIDVQTVPFTSRGSRLLVLSEERGLVVRLAEPRGPHAFHDDAHRLPAALRCLRPTDSEGEPLRFVVSTRPDVLELRTSLGDFCLFFDDLETIVIRLPHCGAGVTFEVPGDALDARDPAAAQAQENAARPVSFASNVALNVTRERSADGASTKLTMVVDAALDPALAIAVASPRRALFTPDPGASQASAENRWREWFRAAPAVSDTYRKSYYYAWWLMAANLVSPRGHVTREAMYPAKMKYIGVWHWDALFHALAYRHADVDLAKQQLYLLLDHQQRDGMLPDVVHEDGLTIRDEHHGDCPVTKPPLIAWVALQLYASGAGRSFLAELYEPLVRWTEWWFQKDNDDDGDGIVQYNHVWSSGLDDSPLWDEGMPVESPDLATYLCRQMQSLAQIAWLLGKKEAAAEWQRRAQAHGKLLVAHFYDPDRGIFWAKRRHRSVPVLTPFNLLPLWSGALDEGQIAATVHHLSDPHEFGTPFPLPTVARSDPAFDCATGWRGPAWINVNYMLVAALRRAGQFHTATTLADQTLALVARHDDIAEYYDPETGAIPPSAAPGFGWSAALFIDLLLRREGDCWATNCP